MGSCTHLILSITGAGRGENPFLVWGEDQSCSQHGCCSFITTALVPVTPAGHQLLRGHTVCPTCCCRFSHEHCESPIPGEKTSYNTHEFIKFWLLTSHQPIAGGLRVFVLERGLCWTTLPMRSVLQQLLEGETQTHSATKPPTNAPRLPLAYQHSMKMQLQ